MDELDIRNIEICAHYDLNSVVENDKRAQGGVGQLLKINLKINIKDNNGQSLPWLG